MSDRDPFRTLPAELMVEIMGYLLPRSLAASIRASPALFNCFMGSQKTLLTQAAHNGLHPESTKDAVAALHFPQFKAEEATAKLACQGIHLLRWEDKTAAFIRAQEAGEFQFPTDVHSLRSLLALLILTEAYIDSLNAFVRTPAEKIRLPEAAPAFGHWQRGTTVITLTDTEHMRLQRAFLRFEFWCRSYGIGGPGTVLPAKYLRKLDTHHYARLLIPHEREELLCVVQYIQSQYDIAFGEVEDDFSHIYRIAHHAMSTEPERDPVLDPPDVTVSSRNLPFFSTAEQRPGQAYIRLMPSFGLGFLRHFVQASSLFRRDFIRSTINYLRRPASTHSGPPLRGQKRSTACAGMARLRPANPLWRRVHRWDCMVGRDFFGAKRSSLEESLRHVGWAIWDKERLRSMGLWKAYDVEQVVQTLSIQPPQYRPGSGVCSWTKVFSRNVWDNHLRAFQAQIWSFEQQKLGWPQTVRSLVEETGFALRYSDKVLTPIL